VTAIQDLSTAAAAPATPAKFPMVPYRHAGSYCDAYFEETARATASIAWIEVDRAARILTEAYTMGATVYSCGNGGSAAIANHLQCDHLKGVRTATDLTPRVVSLSSNVELLTAIANDIGYDEVFSYQLESQSHPGDVLIAISSSGRSPNIVQALMWAREHQVRTIALTGFTGGAARTVAEVSIHVDCSNYGVIEDLHQGAMHAMAQYIRQSRMSPDAIKSSSF
jgi:D-sedoheptulose 7-phosphate isomerase/D-glycero-D-manno-heptose 1,7-bisphosphate phosphatase